MHSAINTETQNGIPLGDRVSIEHSQRSFAALARKVTSVWVVAVVLARERGLCTTSPEHIVLERCEERPPLLVRDLLGFLALVVLRWWRTPITTSAIAVPSAMM